jgi:hypothetical protein
MMGGSLPALTFDLTFKSDLLLRPREAAFGFDGGAGQPPVTTIGGSGGSEPDFTFVFTFMSRFLSW